MKTTSRIEGWCRVWKQSAARPDNQLYPVTHTVGKRGFEEEDGALMRWAYLEVKRVAPLLKAHSYIRHLASLAFNPEHEIARAIEDRLDLGERLGIVDLGE